MTVRVFNEESTTKNFSTGFLYDLDVRVLLPFLEEAVYIFARWQHNAYLREPWCINIWGCSTCLNGKEGYRFMKSQRTSKGLRYGIDGSEFLKGETEKILTVAKKTEPLI